MYSVAIIGAGPAGLMAAEVLIAAGIRVDIYDAMPSVGRKFLMAGKGGLNISHSEPFDTFLQRYGHNLAHIKPLLEKFTPRLIQEWANNLGISTFIGSSGRIFPTDMKAAPLLRSWLHRLRTSGVTVHVRQRWLGWHDIDNTLLVISGPQGNYHIKADAVVLALGGGSWTRLGSTGAWVPLLRERGVLVNTLQPSNCGFDVQWSEHFRSRFSGQPLKSIRILFTNSSITPISLSGECLITDNGIEGGFIYTLSASLRDELLLSGLAIVYIDLLPDTDLSTILAKLSQRKAKESMANSLRKRLGLNGIKAGLLRELLTPLEFDNSTLLATAIKSLPLRLIGIRPIDEAISSAGGVSFDELDEQLMIKSLPGVFCAGEMLDWEAPTGGYLLTGCLATGRAVGLGVLTLLDSLAISK